MALCVIGFDGYFLNYPTQCFFSNNCDNYYSYYYQDQYNTDNLYSIKVPLIRGQLAAGVLMLVSCMGYIFIFVLTSYRIGSATPIPNGSSVPVVPLSQLPPYPNPIYAITSTENPINQSNINPSMPPPYNPPKNELNCPHCRLRFQIATQ
jgi:hypothetical protein